MSIAARLHNAHKERLAKIERIAERNRWNRKAKTEALPKIEADPVTWAEKQIEEHKDSWESVVSAIPITRSIRSIQKATCSVMGEKLHDLLSQRKNKEIVLARQVSIYLAKELTLHSWMRIGKETGGRDHSTVIYSYKKIDRLLKTDEKLASCVALIRESLA